MSKKKSLIMEMIAGAKKLKKKNENLFLNKNKFELLFLFFI